jgi:hypothetical protein
MLQLTLYRRWLTNSRCLLNSAFSFHWFAYPCAMTIKKTARMAGILYLIIIIAGMFSVLFVRNELIISGNPAATAHQLISHESLWRAGIASDLVMHLCDIPVMLIIYILLRPVNRRIALLALLFNIIQTAVLVANKLNLIAALLPLSNNAYFKGMDPQVLYTQSYLAIRLHDIGFGVGLLFFGMTLLANGYLIRKSDYLPKVIGILLQIAGLSYLVSNFTLILAPKAAAQMWLWLMLPCFLAELSFALWLVIKGVNEEKWKR